MAAGYRGVVRNTFWTQGQQICCERLLSSREWPVAHSPQGGGLECVHTVTNCLHESTREAKSPARHISHIKDTHNVCLQVSLDKRGAGGHSRNLSNCSCAWTVLYARRENYCSYAHLVINFLFVSRFFFCTNNKKFKK